MAPNNNWKSPIAFTCYTTNAVETTEQCENWGKMIYRKWSLLTGPTSILAGIVGTIVVADLLFIENDWLRKTDQKKQETSSSTK